MSATATPESGIFRLPAEWPVPQSEPIPAEPPAEVCAEVDAIAGVLAAWGPGLDIDLDVLAKSLAAEIRSRLY